MSKMEYLKDMPVAVLGGGAVGKTCAADIKLAGREVRLYDVMPFAEKSLKDLDKTGILFDGIQRNRDCFERSGRAFIDVVTTDIEKAIKGAGHIVVSCGSWGHEAMFRAMIPYLEDGQVVNVFADNFGALLLRRLMREMGCTKKIIVGGWSSAPYGTRLESIGKCVFPHVSAKYRAITLRGAALPMTDTDDFLEASKHLPCMDAVTHGDGPVAGDTVLDIGFSIVMPVFHVPAWVVGVSSMENWSSIYGNDRDRYSMYSHGLCPSICRVQYQFYQEECAIADAIGIRIPDYAYESFFSRRSILTQEYMGLGSEGEDNVIFPLDKPCDEGNTGPNSIDHRYITEDIPVGCKIYHDLGKKFGVPTPIIDSMIVLGGAMHETSFFEDSPFDLDYLGIGHLDREQLLRYLHTGQLPA